ncbi:MAG TPA: glycosyltransferase 87 family protein [Jatrophihabitantaceae bacterium]|jgi:alpha-1,2-mannosyltransferase
MTTRTARTTALCLALAIAFASARWLGDVWHWPLLDLSVYRRGAGELLSGRSLYDSAPHYPHPELPFTYPPFAAALFVPAYEIGPVLSGVGMSLLSLGCYALVTLVCGRRLGLPWSALAPLAALGLALEPVQRTFWLGQVNLLLAAMVVADCFLVPVKARGLLTGIAAGIKIIPGVYVIYFLLRREWLSVLRAALAFAATVGVSAIASPHDATHFWTKLFWDPNHVGQQAYISNQSLYGQLVRFTRDLHPATAVYAPIAVGALSLAVYAAIRQLRIGNDVAALTCVAFGGLLASPISWSHHWVWFVPAILVLIARGQRRAAALLALVPALAPEWWTPSTQAPYTYIREFHHHWWQTWLCLSYAVAGVAFLVLMARTPRAQRSGAADLDNARRTITVR